MYALSLFDLVLMIYMFGIRYEKSYMHRDVVTHVAVSAADFFITGSIDGTFSYSFEFFTNIYKLFFLFQIGHLKFWKKKGVGIEFAKHFRSHLGPIQGLAVRVSSISECFFVLFRVLLSTMIFLPG